MESRKIITLEDVRMLFKNFSGEARQYNNAGDRNFNVVVNAEQADMLRQEGFRVKELASRDDFDSEPTYVMKVKVSYRYSEPKVVLIAGRARRMLNEDTIGELDYADVSRVDLTIKPSRWTQANGDSGVTAYLNSLYATLVEDPLAEKYAEMEEEEDPF